MTTIKPSLEGDAAPFCPLCGATGRIALRDLRDEVFGNVQGVWSLRKCTNTSCRLLWLDPMPACYDLGKAYETYYTHAPKGTPQAKGWARSFYKKMQAAYLSTSYGCSPIKQSATARLLAPLLRLHPPRKTGLDYPHSYLRGLSPGRFLEVGCGSGKLLERMAECGWNVYGLDSDAQAIALARAKGINAVVTDLHGAGFPSEQFHAVVFHHVWEHLHNPLDVLLECRRILVPGGKLIIVQPNTSALGAWLFSDKWRGLEVPRHLLLYNIRAMRQLARKAGIEPPDFSVRSSVRGGIGILRESFDLQTRGCCSRTALRATKGLVCEFLWLLEWVLVSFGLDVGEELHFVYTKPTSQQPCERRRG